MLIKSLEFTGVHGYLNKKIDFFKDLTLLVGINGAGKTTVLNILNCVLTPKIPDLILIQFELIRVIIEVSGIEYKINCSYSQTVFRYEIESMEKTYQPLTYNLKYKPSLYFEDPILKAEIKNEITHIGPDETELETWNLLASFPKPTIMGLDRSLYTEGNNIYRNEKSDRAKRESKTIPLSPLDKVNSILNKEYTSIKNEVSKLTIKLRNYLMLSTFQDSVITKEQLNTPDINNLSIEQIEMVENRLKVFFKENEKDTFSESEMELIINYFVQLKKVVIDYESDSSEVMTRFLYALNSNQFSKINLLIEQFERIEKISTQKLSQIKQFLQTINYFFKDSSKEALFDESLNELTFNNLDINNQTINKLRDIRQLSSGEQQILTLLTNIAFDSQGGKVFLLDEPELSLHIKWQEDFLSQMRKVTPITTQIIIATHSPVIANEQKNKAKILFPYN